MNELVGVIDGLVDGGSNFAESLGINRVAGQLYVLLFFSSRPLCLDEMTERLKISKGHVSTNIRALERWQAVRKVWVKGSRKDYYEANSDTLKIVLNQLNYGLEQRFAEFEKGIAAAKKHMENDYPGRPETSEAKNLADKLKQIENMHKRVKSLLDKALLINFLT